MSIDLNKIELTPEIISGLYKNTLVDIEERVPANNEKNSQPSWIYLGSNKKKILLLAQFKGMKNIPPAYMEFLNGMISACKLNIDDVVIMNIDGQPGLDIKSLLSYFKSQVVILFGIIPTSLGLPIGFPHFQVQPFDGVTYLSTPTLEELSEDKVLKSKLWVCLKRIFNL